MVSPRRKPRIRCWRHCCRHKRISLYARSVGLFYVAVTLARQRAYLIADMAVASAFVVELLKNEYELDLDEF